MQRASEFLNEEQRKQIETAVSEAETITSCEIVPVVATSSGRYDRAEDMVGLWLAVLAAAIVWWFFPRQPSEPGSWGGTFVGTGLLTMVIAVLVSFMAGAIAASRLGWLRRLFTPRKQMLDEVSARAREVFFDQRVHHTSGASGVLIYVSLFEHMAVVLGDQMVLERFGQESLDQLCQQLTQGLHRGGSADTICSVIAATGKQFAEGMPRTQEDVNELQDTLILID